MIEVHVGVPQGIDTSSFEGFDWSSVASTLAGADNVRDYLGHSVDGQLGAIGTAYPRDEQLEPLLVMATSYASQAPGSRLEVELIEDTTRTNREQLDLVVSSLEATGAICRVPAPAYEQHIRVVNGDEPDQLEKEIGALLGDQNLFELTTFGPYNPKAIVTAAAETIDKVMARVTLLAKSIMTMTEGVTVGPVEEIVGAWSVPSYNI